MEKILFMNMYSFFGIGTRFMPFWALNRKCGLKILYSSLQPIHLRKSRSPIFFFNFVTLSYADNLTNEKNRKGLNRIPFQIRINALRMQNYQVLNNLICHEFFLFHYENFKIDTIVKHLLLLLDCHIISNISSNIEKFILCISL